MALPFCIEGAIYMQFIIVGSDLQSNLRCLQKDRISAQDGLFHASVRPFPLIFEPRRSGFNERLSTGTNYVYVLVRL